MAPQLQAGQTVRYSSGILRPSAGGDYEIVRPLPEHGGEQHYLIKSALEPYERVAKERELPKP
jgi:hypothetical protein